MLKYTATFISVQGRDDQSGYARLISRMGERPARRSGRQWAKRSQIIPPNVRPAWRLVFCGG